MIARRAIRVFSCIRLLRRNIETGKQPRRLVEVEVVDVAATFFVKELESQQTQQGAGRRNVAVGTVKKSMPMMSLA